MSHCVAIGPSSFAAKDDTPLKMLETAGCTIKPNPFKRRLTEEEIIEHLEGVDGLIAGLEPLNRKVLSSAAPRLKAVARVGIGVANVDFDAAAELGIKVTNTPDPPMRAVAEATVTALLALLRNLHRVNDALHRGEWDKSVQMGLEGLPVLLVGYGRIGRRVAHLLRAFDAEVLVSDPNISAESLLDSEELVTLEEGLSRAKAISLHASGEDEVIGAKEFKRMAKGAYLLNSARGGLVNEEALKAALDDGTLAGAWFDAFWKEPYTGPLQDYPQVLMTPHSATYTVQCRLDMETQAVTHLLNDLGAS